MTRRNSQAGVTLIEITIAVTMLSLLVLGMALALRTGLSAYSKTNARLMEIRRVTGAQRVLHQELDGMIPAYIACGTADPNGVKAALFQGETNVMRLVSSFSLQQGWRGRPQILEMFVLPGDEGEGVRLVVNEIPYSGIKGTGGLCTEFMASSTGAMLPKFVPVVPRPGSFVLADKLAYCRFSYYSPSPFYGQQPVWVQHWEAKGWPLGIRVEMAPLKPDPSQILPITVTVPLHIRRDAEKKYADEY